MNYLILFIYLLSVKLINYLILIILYLVCVIIYCASQKPVNTFWIDSDRLIVYRPIKLKFKKSKRRRKPQIPKPIIQKVKCGRMVRKFSGEVSRNSKTYWNYERRTQSLGYPLLRKFRNVLFHLTLEIFRNSTGGCRTPQITVYGLVFSHLIHFHVATR